MQATVMLLRVLRVQLVVRRRLISLPRHFTINHLKSLAKKKKRTVSSLSQVAAGIAGGSLSDSSDGAIIAAKTAKDSVENNNFALDSVMNNPQVDWTAEAKAQEKISEAERQSMVAFEKEHPELVKKLKTTGDIASFVADFTLF